jgi:hypothetical protein
MEGMMLKFEDLIEILRPLDAAVVKAVPPIVPAPTVQLPIVLLAADVQRAAREAYMRGELQVQTTYVDSAHCSYKGPCAIGVAMTPEQREFCDNQVCPEIDRLIRDGIVETDDEDYLTALQEAHDEDRNLLDLLGIQDGGYQPKGDA